MQIIHPSTPSPFSYDSGWLLIKFRSSLDHCSLFLQVQVPFSLSHDGMAWVSMQCRSWLGRPLCSASPFLAAIRQNLVPRLCLHLNTDQRFCDTEESGTKLLFLKLSGEGKRRKCLNLEFQKSETKCNIYPDAWSTLPWQTCLMSLTNWSNYMVFENCGTAALLWKIPRCVQRWKWKLCHM